MEKIRKFTHIRFGEIRFMEFANSILFITDDILRALEYNEPETAIPQHCENATKKIIEMADGWREVNLIPESDVYRLARKSNSIESGRFQDWICECLHPTLIETNQHFNPKLVKRILSDPDTIIHLATCLKQEQHYRMEAEKLNQVNAAKWLFATAVEASHKSILVGEFAKILRQNGIKIGQNRLFQWLRGNNFLCKSGEQYNYPTQKAMDMGLFEIKKTTISKPDGTILVATTPKITGKGQIYLLNKFMTAS